MHGWRAKIGVIDLASSTTILPEYYRVMPEGVTAYTARLVLPGCDATAENLARMAESPELEVAAEQLALAEVDVITFACTTGSLVKGVGWDKAIIDRIESRTGVRATTTTTAVLAALRALGVTTLGIATPYIDELNELEHAFFEAHGYRVAAIRGLGIRDDREMGRQRPEVAYRLARSVDGPGIDCLFISCTNFRTIEIISALEADAAKPVVTSNQATIWDSLRRAGVGEGIGGHGRLLELPPAP